MSDDPGPEMEWAHCSQCLRSTRHAVIERRQLKEREELENGEYVIDWVTTYTMLECNGCGDVVLRRNLFSDDVDVDETTYYPPLVSRQIPRWTHDLPPELRELLKETYTALHAGSKRLAMMGARSLVDQFMTSTLGDVGGFEKKLDGLTTRGLLSQQNKGVLEVALEAGHAVTHRGHAPGVDDVNIVFEVYPKGVEIG